MARQIDVVGVCIFVAALLVASPGLFTYFSFDDYIYLHQAERQTVSVGAFFSPFWTFSPWVSYRPLPSMYWSILFGLFGAAPLPYELGVMALYAAMVFFVYRIGRLLGGRLSGAVAAGLVALYFPIYSVSWSRWSSSLQMELFFLASGMYYLLRWATTRQEANSRTGLPIGGIILIVCAFLSKETSFLAPLLLPVLVPRKPVVRVSAVLFVSGVVLFVLTRSLIPSQFPPRSPIFEFSLIAKNLEFFLRKQFLVLLPASLIVISALARGRRWRFVWVLGIAALFLGMNVFCGYSQAAHRAKLLVCMAAVALAAFRGPNKVRFPLAWAGLLILPPLSVQDTTVHQSAESFIGLSLFIGLGVARHILLAGRLCRAREWRAAVARAVSGSPVTALRLSGLLVTLLIIGYAAFCVAKMNIAMGVPEARKMVQASRLTRDVREYLCRLSDRARVVHSTNLPGLISVPDIAFDARLHGCRLHVDGDFSAETGLFVFADGEKRREFASLRAKGRVVARLVRAPYKAVILSVE